MYLGIGAKNLYFGLKSIHCIVLLCIFTVYCYSVLLPCRNVASNLMWHLF